MLHYRPELVDMSNATSKGNPSSPYGTQMEEFYQEKPIMFAPKDDVSEEDPEAAIQSHMVSAQYARRERGEKTLEALVEKSIAAVEAIKNKKVQLRNVGVPM